MRLLVGDLQLLEQLLHRLAPLVDQLHEELRRDAIALLRHLAVGGQLHAVNTVR